jgi:ABC-type nitrate/sulfonate/bicarbonate transport system permease component
VDARLIHVARSLGASHQRIALQVILPATVPYLLTGARVTLGVAWMSIIAAELLGAPTGLGFSIQYARMLQQTPKMLAWILWVGVVGFVLDAGLRAAVRRLAPWAGAGRLTGEPA